MTMIFKTFLTLHILGGTFGLLTGMMNILRKKGDNNHKLIGKVFFVSMVIAGISALVLSCIHPNYFLFMVGLFTLYMVCSGQRYLHHKQHSKVKSKATEWTMTILMLLAGLLFIGIGIFSLIQSKLFGIVFITFGSLGLLFVRQDFENYLNKTTINNYWLTAHLQRMTGSFIAALTAFLVVNEKYFPDQIPSFIFWLLPTVSLTPLIIKWSRQYRVKNK